MKTSTGYGPAGARVEDVKLMRAALLPEIQIKASGGIRSHREALALLQAGASRIGTSSGVVIVEESRKV
jgi:deoxyribose-phosphate aldolase